LTKDLPTPILELLWRGEFNTVFMPRHELLDILLIYFYYINRKGNDREQVAAMPLLERTGGWCEPVEGQAGEYIPGAAR